MTADLAAQARAKLAERRLANLPRIHDAMRRIVGDSGLDLEVRGIPDPDRITFRVGPLIVKHDDLCPGAFDAYLDGATVGHFVNGDGLLRLLANLPEVRA